MTEKKAQFLPFNAINEFMIAEYQRKVLQKVLGELEKLPENRRKSINGFIKRYVQIAGFRNTLLAPLMLKVKNAIPVFEKYPEFTVQIIAAWAELNAGLCGKTYDLLKARGWELLPPEADRTQLPGFLTKWHKDETFDTINKAFSEMYPEGGDATTDDVSLMAVWLSGRLPLQLEEDKTTDESGTDSPVAEL